MQWKTIALILLTAVIGVGTISYTDLFGGILQITGVNYTHTGDIKCGDTCEIFLNVTTSYYQLCFEHSNRSDVIYQKTALSRTLWVNLQNVKNIITTNPDRKVDWLVPAVGVNKWRPVKDGDCWMRGKVNKNKLVGHKAPRETVKWGFQLTDKTKQYILLDPIWEGTNELSHEFSSNYEVKVFDDQTGIIDFYTSPTFVDNIGTTFKDSKSLKNIYSLNIDLDPRFNLTIGDWNYTSIKDFCYSANETGQIPLQIYIKDNNEDKELDVKINILQANKWYCRDITLKRPITDYQIKWGFNSTTAQIIYGSNITADVTTKYSEAGGSFAEISAVKYNISYFTQYPIVNVVTASYAFWCGSGSGSLDNDINISRAPLQTWVDSLTCTTFNSTLMLAVVNSSLTVWNATPAANVWVSVNYTKGIQTDIRLKNNYTTIVMFDPDTPRTRPGMCSTDTYNTGRLGFGRTAGPLCYFNSSSASTNQPYLTVTFNYDILPPTWSGNKSKILNAGYTSEFNISWSEESTFSEALFESNISGSQANYTMNLVTGTVYNYSAIITSAGSYYWKSWGTDTYNNRNVTDTWIFNIIEANPPAYSNIGVSNSNPSILDNVIFSSYWTDDTALDKFIFSWNGTGVLCDTWANDTAAAFSSGWANVTKQIPAACLGKIGGIAWQVFGNDTTNNKNNTPVTLSFTETPTVNPCTPPASGTFNVTTWCNFTSTYQIAGDINCSSAGIMNITGTLNFTGTNQRFIMMDGCKRWLQGTGKWGKFQ